MKRTISATCVAVALVAGVAGCGGSDDAGNPDSELTPAEVSEPLHGAPPQLQEIRAQANQLLDGGTDAINARLEELRGTPVVINNWGSWCAPCRAEFPIFQGVSNRLGAEVAFLGVDSDDPEDAARTFLRELPVPYPSYLDPDNDIKNEVFDNPVGLPNTAFYDSSGKRVYVHQGPYASEDELEAEIARYAR